MSGLAIAALTWVAMSPFVGVVIGKAIKLADLADQR